MRVAHKNSKGRFVEADTPKAFFDLITETYAQLEKEKKARGLSQKPDPTKR